MHEQWQEQIPLYSAGRLSVMERNALENHLQTCATCREQATQWEQVAAVVRTEVEGRALKLPALDRSRFPSRTWVRAHEHPLKMRRNAAQNPILDQNIPLAPTVNGSPPANARPLHESKHKRKSDMALSSLPLRSPQSNPRSQPMNVAAVILFSLFTFALFVGLDSLSNPQNLPPGLQPGAGANQNGSGTPTPVPSGTPIVGAINVVIGTPFPFTVISDPNATIEISYGTLPTECHPIITYVVMDPTIHAILSTGTPAPYETATAALATLSVEQATYQATVSAYGTAIVQTYVPSSVTTNCTIFVLVPGPVQTGNPPMIDSGSKIIITVPPLGPLPTIPNVLPPPTLPNIVIPTMPPFPVVSPMPTFPTP